MERRIPLSDFVSRSRGIDRLLENTKGVPCPYPKVVLRMRMEDEKEYVQIQCIFDTGADMMVIPQRIAAAYQLEYRKDDELRGTPQTLGGPVACFYDFVHVGCHLTGREYKWPCRFTSKGDHVLLGRSGFLDEFAVAIVDDEFVIVPHYKSGLFRNFRNWFRRRSWFQPHRPIGPREPL